MDKIKIHTDGACLGNPGPGGWAFVAEIDGKIYEKSGHIENTTNNRAEYLAAIEAIKFASQFGNEFTILTDSQLLYDTMTKWIYSWEKKNWRKSDGKPVQNLDLVLILWELMHQYKIQWAKVTAHSGIEFNERCDKLAKDAANKIEIIDNFVNNQLFTDEMQINEVNQLISEDGTYKLKFNKKSNTIELFQNHLKIAKFKFNKEFIQELFK